MIRFLNPAYRAARKMFFTKEKPDGPFLTVDATISELERELGQNRYAPNWKFSYNFRGENLNLAARFHEYNDEYPTIKWWQFHVRGWMRADGNIDLRSHYEAEATEYPSEHLNGVGYDVDAGMGELRWILDESDIDIVRDTYDPV